MATITEDPTTTDLSQPDQVVNTATGETTEVTPTGGVTTTDGDPQSGLFDRDLRDEKLESLLDRREALKAEKAEAVKAYKEMDDAVKARLGEFELADGEVARVGKYRIEKKATAARSVSFETSPSSRIQIKLFDA